MGDRGQTVDEEHVHAPVAVGVELADGPDDGFSVMGSRLDVCLRSERIWITPASNCALRDRILRMATFSEKTAPKPFVFVLMPFDRAFDDIYSFGIKGAAQDAGAYAERVDEQIYTEGILDRIFNQINKSDVIVADMTGRNPNVFYEVGYAHALNKVVILLTQDATDIPFDLKHRQHIVYGGRIDDLRKELRVRLRWAIQESSRRDEAHVEEQFAVYLAGKEIARTVTDSEPTVLAVKGARTESSSEGDFSLRFAVRNDSSRNSEPIRHVYLFTTPDSPIYPISHLGYESVWASNRSSGRLPFPAKHADAYDGLSEQYHLKGEVPALPPGGVETSIVAFRFVETALPLSCAFRLRLHNVNRTHDFSFGVELADVKVIKVAQLKIPQG